MGTCFLIRSLVGLRIEVDLGSGGSQLQLQRGTLTMPSLSPHSSHDLTQDEVLKRDIPWETYMSTKLISGTGLQLLRRYDHRPEHVQAALLDESGAEYIQLFSGILSDITKEETVEYVLALIDDMLSANPQRTQLFYDKSLSNDNVYLPFLRLLSKNNWFIQEKCCKILTLVISARPKVQRGVHGKERESEVSEILESLIDWLCNQLRKPHEVKGITAAMSFLAILLRESHVRILFMKADGVRLLGPLIKPASTQQSVQLLYEAMLCIWLLSFYDAALDAIATARILPRMVEALKSSTKEKVVRVTVLALKNLVNRNTFAADMVDLGLLKIVQGLKLQAWNDEDLLEALDSLEVSLKTNIRTLSSFDKYKQEVLSGNLEWTPVHKDQVFWRENIKKFEDNDFQVLRVLITILNSSSEPKSLAVACHDVSQFIQNYPSGRLIAIDLKAKDEVMRLMTHESPQVRKEALICVQKLLLSSKFASYMQS